MNSFARRFSWFLGGLAMFAVFTAILVFTVTYKPYGVPDSRRAEYEAKLAEIKRRSELVRELGDQARPIFKVNKTEHDFGMIDPHTTATYDFTISNEGVDPLSVQIRETSCKCTMGDLKNPLLLPGESTKVTLTWNTGYKAEEYTQTATLVTNDPLKETVVLTVSGEVRAKFIAPDKIGFNKSDPGVETDSRFVVFSQLWDDFVIEDIRADRESFDWHAEPISNDSPELADKDPKSAWKLTLLTTNEEFGEYSGTLTLVVKPNDGTELVEHEISYKGKIRAPINFYGPEIHKTDGLDIGTLSNNKDHHFHLAVRVRGDVERKIDILDVEPKELSASLEPLKTAGSYRLTITIPKNCRSLRFNADQKHGYVQVGDPQNERFSNWFPLLGAIVDLDQ